MNDHDIAFILDRYPDWSPLFGELSATLDGRVMIIGFQTGNGCVLKTADVAAAVAYWKQTESQRTW